MPSKPHPMGNGCRSTACCLSGVMWSIEMREGKDRSPELNKPLYEGAHGKIGSVLTRMCESAHISGKSIILHSGFCVLKAIISLMSYVMFSSSLIEKRRRWTNHYYGAVCNDHFSVKPVGHQDAMKGTFNNIPFCIVVLKEP